MEASDIVGQVSSKAAEQAREQCRGCGQCFQQLNRHLLTTDCSKHYDVTERRAIAKEKVIARKKGVYCADKNNYKKSKSRYLK